MSSSVMKYSGAATDGAAALPVRRPLRSRPGSGRASVWCAATPAAARSTSMPARPSRVGIRSTWLVGVVMPPAIGCDAGAAHDERDVCRFVERVAPLLLQAAVGAEQVAMVGREHDDRVVGHARRLQRVEDPPDRLVDDLVEVVVELAVRQVERLVGDHLWPHRLEQLLARGPAGERVGLRGRLGDVGHGVVDTARNRAATCTARRRTRCRAGSRTRRPRATVRRWRPAPARRTTRRPARRTRRRGPCHSRTSPRHGLHGRSTRRTRTGSTDPPCGTPPPRGRSRRPSSSDAITPSWLPGISRSAWLTCHLPR